MSIASRVKRPDEPASSQEQWACCVGMLVATWMRIPSRYILVCVREEDLLLEPGCADEVYLWVVCLICGVLVMCRSRRVGATCGAPSCAENVAMCSWACKCTPPENRNALASPCTCCGILLSYVY